MLKSQMCSPYHFIYFVLQSYFLPFPTLFISNFFFFTFCDHVIAFATRKFAVVRCRWRRCALDLARWIPLITISHLLTSNIRLFQEPAHTNDQGQVIFLVHLENAHGPWHSYRKYFLPFSIIGSLHAFNIFDLSQAHGPGTATSKGPQHTTSSRSAKHFIRIGFHHYRWSALPPFSVGG